MRSLLALLGLVLVACPNPDDGFRLSGRVVDQDGVPVPNHEVRVLRDASPDGERCVLMEPFATLVTDERGTYGTTVYRFQQTLGQVVPRYFRVETTSVSEPTWVTAGLFRFGPVDAALPELPIARRSLGVVQVPVSFVDSFTEAELDGYLAWRGDFEVPVEDRTLTVRRVDRVTRDTFTDANLLGIDSQWLSFEMRLERPFRTLTSELPSLARGGGCSVAPQTACPLTDGRLLPVVLPPLTTSVAVTVPAPAVVGTVFVHGLQVEGTPAQVVLESGTRVDEGLEWRPWAPVPRGKEVIEWSRTHCRDRGAFFKVFAGVREVDAVRVSVFDAEGNRLRLTSMAELALR
ncbi:MAG: hypothetical protein MUC96_12735 [Myxococcaceae bacterium]|jgi:hypothetical protein|nr:hypothetical protein [Myxococcaceae bacterium]